MEFLIYEAYITKLSLLLASGSCTAMVSRVVQNGSLSKAKYDIWLQIYNAVHMDLSLSVFCSKIHILQCWEVKRVETLVPEG